MIVGEQRDGHGFVKFQSPDYPVAPAPPATATRAASHGKALHRHWVTPLQHLEVGEPGVGHVGVDGGCPCKAGAGAGAATDGLVILVGCITEREIVHRTLAIGEYPERTKQGIDD